MKIEKGKLYYCISGGNVIKSAIDWNDESGDFTDKIAVYCPIKNDIDYIRNVLGDINHCRPYVFINDKYGSFHDNNNYHIITIEEFKKFYTQTQTQMKPTHFAISPEEYQEWQEYKNSKKKPLELVYCMQDDGEWYDSDYSHSENDEFTKLHKVNYKGVEYDLITTSKSVYLGHVK